MLVTAALWPCALQAAPDQPAGHLTIELNKVEQTAQGCRPVFLFGNQTGHQLSRFQVDLVLFDPKGVYSKQVLLDMAPLYDGKQVLASFLLDSLACNGIGRILVNKVPQCQNSSGAELDCVQLLQVSSRSSIPLEK